MADVLTLKGCFAGNPLLQEAVPVAEHRACHDTTECSHASCAQVLVVTESLALNRLLCNDIA